MKIFILHLFLFISSSILAQNNPCEIINKTVATFEKKHISPTAFNETTKHQIIDLYLESIDSDKLIFSKQDSLTIHNAIDKVNSLCNVFSLTQPLIIKKLQKEDSLIKTINLSYIKNNTVVEKLKLNCSKTAVYQNNEIARQNYLKKYFKYQFLKKCFQLKVDSIQLAEEKILANIINKTSKAIHKLIENEGDLLSIFLNAYCLRADPHSEFFESNEKDEWLTHLSREELSFGFGIDITENDEVKIKEMVPGGAAWNNKQIEVGDIIEAIELANGKKYFLAMEDNDEILKLISAKENIEISFYFNKTDGTKYKVKLRKSSIEVAENVINAYIFKVNNQKLGYIDLPSFYSSNPMLGYNGCASDLAREILNLKKDSIQGLIIDLRNNGGGYMDEALDIAGLFINEGILALKQEKGDKPRYLKDANRGTVYDGKLIVLVNNYSASASELLAGTLQKYNRAIIVGNNTFGKGTMQQMFPIDSAAELRRTNKYYAKITTGKFYMINKKTHQGTGIIVDIYLPGLLDYLNPKKEQEYNYYLKPDSIVKNTDIQLFPAINLSQLKSNAETRIKKGNWHPKFKSLADTLNEFDCQSKEIVLEKNAIFKIEKSRNDFFKRFEKNKIVDFAQYPVSNTSLYNKYLKEHEIHNKPNQYKIERINIDIRLYETLNILSEYINQ